MKLSTPQKAVLAEVLFKDNPRDYLGVHLTIATTYGHHPAAVRALLAKGLILGVDGFRNHFKPTCKGALVAQGKKLRPSALLDLVAALEEALPTLKREAHHGTREAERYAAAQAAIAAAKGA